MRTSPLDDDDYDGYTRRRLILTQPPLSPPLVALRAGFKWLAVNITAKNLVEAQTKGMGLATDYFGGNNERGKRLNMTVPTFTILYPTRTKGRSVEPVYTIAYWLPRELQRKPPQPKMHELEVCFVRVRTAVGAQPDCCL